mmetsp:Transcript_294/g.560  ORF Transcript_294/g.560 Transcript_294/m.560 type:complete len:212 (+) Transcript_294:132-767(+)
MADMVVDCMSDLSVEVERTLCMPVDSCIRLRGSLSLGLPRETSVPASEAKSEKSPSASSSLFAFLFFPSPKALVCRFFFFDGLWDPPPDAAELAREEAREEGLEELGEAPRCFFAGTNKVCFFWSLSFPFSPGFAFALVDAAGLGAPCCTSGSGNKAFNTALCPFTVAVCRIVRPLPSRTFASALKASSVCSAEVLPLMDATCNGVWPSRS